MSTEPPPLRELSLGSLGDPATVDHRQSHVQGAQAAPLTDDTIGERLRRTAREVPEAEALVSLHQGLRWTYAELDRRTDAFASGLLALGLEPGDRVGVWAPNCAEWAVAQFATARAGLILVSINPAYRTSELEHVLNKVGCAGLITAPRFKSSDYLQMLRTLAPELDRGAPSLRAERLPALRHVITLGPEAFDGCRSFAQVCDLGDGAGPETLAAAAARVRPGDAVNIQFTSGTTGSPKGATLSHRNLLNNGYFVGAATGVARGSRVCIPVPLYHCFGMVMGNLACLAHGATMVYPGAGFEPLAVLEAVARERCDILYGVPTMFIAELNHPEFARFDLSSLKGGIMAGAPCPIEIMRAVVEKMHMGEITIGYGMTETSPISFQSSRDDPLELRVSTVGRVQPHLEVKIVDPAGKTVPLGTAGEICTRGYSVMLGYWNEEAKTAEVLDADGWMHTGDLGTLDADGFCRIVGRSKDMVIRGGENISPREIEEYLFLHPAVQDVQVIGVPDARLGEEVCAWIVLKPGSAADEENIRAFCRDRIAHYKIPRYVRFVSAFPQTATGKVQKFAMRNTMIEEMAVSASDATPSAAAPA